MTDDEILEMGRAADALLSEPTYMQFFMMTKQDILECIANTLPEATTERESLYHQLNGLSEVLHHMQSYVSRAEQIAQDRRDAEEDIDE